MKFPLTHLSRIVAAAVFGLNIGLSACGSRYEARSSLDVTDVAHTAVKRQSIGNCWLYATATWAEALHLAETGVERNLSESYWTYWHWYQTIPYSGDHIETGGLWTTASALIQSYGWIEEGDFIPGESSAEMSNAQANAETYVNQQLSAGGALARRADRTPDNIRKVLDKAFGVDMTEALKKAHAATEFAVGHGTDGLPISLAAVIAGARAQSEWQSVTYPVVFGPNAQPSTESEIKRLEILKRVMRALNDRKPVIIDVSVDFNAIARTPYSTFDLETLRAASSIGRQGGHLLVLEDYTVKNVPGVGDIGEGDVSAELKLAALDGELVTLKAKNSWGTDRPERGLTDGYTSFKLDYLNAVIPWRYDQNNPNSAVYWTNPLKGFVLPPGY